MPKFEMDEIHRGLWQGSRPPYGHTLARAGFDMLVLCAFEFQPPLTVCDWAPPLPPEFRKEPFPGLEIVYAPNDDNFFVYPSRQQLKTAVSAADKVAQKIREGGKVLVTCWQGWNRSGLVSAITLHKLFGFAGEECVQHVKAKRREALSNKLFVEVISRIPAGGRPLTPLLESVELQE